MTTYSTFLPVFSGFYCNDNYEINYESEIDYINSERAYKKLSELTDIELDVDYDSFMIDVCQELCSHYEGMFNDNCETTQIKIKYVKIHSPREYNFTNDSVECEIECDVIQLLQICRDNLESFTDYLRRNYKSYDGFISSYSYDVNEWLDVEYINENPYQKVGALLNFICTEIYKINEPDLYELNITDSNYFTNVDYYLALQAWNDATVCFTNVENFDKGCFWFRTYSSLVSDSFEFDNEFRTIQFLDITERILNELQNSPLIDFEYSLEFCEK